MNELFETVKAAVTPRQAAEYYGLTVGRGDMVRCPFHEDRRPSMKLYGDHFYCFGCGERGDVVKLTGKLLDLRPWGAAKRLCRDFGLDPRAGAAAYRPVPPRASRDEALRCIRVLTRYRHLLRQWRQDYAPEPDQHPWDPRFREALQNEESVSRAVDNLLELPEDSRRTLTGSLVKSGLIEKLERRLERMEKQDPLRKEGDAEGRGWQLRSYEGDCHTLRARGPFGDACSRQCAHWFAMTGRGKVG